MCSTTYLRSTATRSPYPGYVVETSSYYCSGVENTTYLYRAKEGPGLPQKGQILLELGHHGSLGEEELDAVHDIIVQHIRHCKQRQPCEHIEPINSEQYIDAEKSSDRR